MESISRVERFLQYTITLRPVTPVHVWSGSNATLGVEALIQGGRLYVLFFDDLLKLARSGGTGIECLERVGMKGPESHEFDMYTLLKCLVDKHLSEPVAIVKTTIDTTRRQSIKLVHQDLVPGSTIKGYLRTAILRKLINTLPPGKAKEAIKSGVNLYTEPKRMSEGLEARFYRRPRPGGVGGFYDFLELLKVSDPEVIRRDLSLRKLIVAYRADLRPIAEIFAIVIDPLKGELASTGVKNHQSVLKYTVTIDTREIKYENVYLKIDEHKSYEDAETSKALREIIEFRNEYAKKLADKGFLLSSLREHGCFLIENELEKIRGVKDRLRHYANLLESLKEELCVETSRCVPARIGYMTGHEAKTILDIVEKLDEETYKQVTTIMGRIVKRSWDSLTLKLVEYDGELVGVGWCTLCIE